MARQLLMYKGITPNVSDNRYYYCSPQDFLTEIHANLIGSIDLDNYRLEANMAKINYAVLPLADAEKVTYLIEYDASTNYFNCFHVEHVEVRNDFALYRISIDLWQTYIWQGSLSNIHITRCNRNIGDGVYDEIANTKPASVGYTSNDIYMATWDGAGWLTSDKNYAYEDYIVIVFAVEYNVEQQVFGSDHISETGLYCVDFTTLRGLVDATHANSAGVNIASDIIGGIYGVASSWGGSELDARVINAWIMPTAFLTKSGYGHNFKSKSSYAGNSNVTFLAEQVLPRRSIKDVVDLPNSPNYAVYFGTFNNGLKLKHYTSSNLRVKVITNVSQTSLNVLVEQGENQKDITSAFEVTLTTNAGVTTGIRQFAKAFSNAVSMGSSMAKDLAKGDVSSAGLGLAKGVVDMIPLKPSIDGAIGGGDGGTTFYSTHTTTSGNVTTYYTHNPLCAFYFESTCDEEAHARLYGALFDAYNITDLEDLLTYSLLGTGTLTDTYVKATARLEGVPLDARNYILSNLGNGVYLKII